MAQTQEIKTGDEVLVKMANGSFHSFPVAGILSRSRKEPFEIESFQVNVPHQRDFSIPLELFLNSEGYAWKRP